MPENAPMYKTGAAAVNLNPLKVATPLTALTGFVVPTKDPVLTGTVH